MSSSLIKLKLAQTGFLICCRSFWGVCGDEGVVSALVPPAPPKAPALHSQTAPPSGPPFPLSAAGAGCWCCVLSWCCSPRLGMGRDMSWGPWGFLLCVGQGAAPSATPVPVLG